MKSWTTKQLEHEGLPLLLRFPENLDVISLRSTFPVLAVINHQLSNVSANGLPDPDYNDRLLHFDQGIRKAFESSREGVTVLIETFGGRRNYYIYIASGVDVAAHLAQLTKRHPQEKLSWSVHEDRDWGFIDGYSKKFL